MTSSPPSVDQPLERIIARVIRDVLRETSAGTEPAAGAASAAKTAPAATRPAEPGTLRLPDAVLSLASLQGRIDERIGRLIVGSRAVVTPAVRDELRARGIALVRVASGVAAPDVQTEPGNGAAAGSGPEPGASRFLLADADRHDRTAGLARQLQLRGIAGPTTVDTGAALARLRDAGASAVVLAELPQPVVCDACRHPHVRAAAVQGPSEVARLVRAMQPNLWVLDMGRLNFAAAVATAAACFRAASYAPRRP